jgi:O-antigen/teichoic acid export membrane protein
VKPRRSPPDPGHSAGDLESSAAGVLLGSAAAIVGSFGVRMIAARSLDATALGALLLVVAVASFAGTVAGLGLRSATARRVADLRATGQHSGAARAARTALSTALLTGTLAAFLVPLLPFLGLGELARLAPALLLAATPACLGLPLGVATWGISQGHHDTRGRALLRDASGSLLRLGGIALAALLAGDVWVYALAWGLGSLAGEGAFVAYGVRQGWLSGAEPGADRDLLRSLPPYTGTTLVSQLGTWLDLLLLGALAPLAVVGSYGLAQSLGRVLGQVSASASHRFLPLATVAVAAGDDEGLAGHFRHARELAFRYLWVALAPCLLCPEALVRLAFGPGFEDAAAALYWLAAGWLVRGVAGYPEEALIARGQAGSMFKVVLASTGLSAALLVLWVPELGATGAARAVAAGQAFRGAAGLALLGSLGLAACRPRDLLRLLAPTVPAIAVGLLATRLAGPPWLAPALVVLAAAPAALATAGRTYRSAGISPSG